MQPIHYNRDRVPGSQPPLSARLFIAYLQLSSARPAAADLPHDAGLGGEPGLAVGQAGLQDCAGVDWPGLALPGPASGTPGLPGTLHY